jgi:hypothetical protein
MKIVIIQHENDSGEDGGVYFIEMIARCWRERGHEVEFIRHLNHRCVADVAVLHVNLSVVPEDYLAYAKEFPVTLNGKLSDIRKRQISAHLVGPRSPYEGPVIIKTDLNYAGFPEKILLQQASPRMRTFGNYLRFVRRNSRKVLRWFFSRRSDKENFAASSYRGTFRILANKDRVPSHLWGSRDWVVEKFLPEVEGDRFVIRHAYFLGDRCVGFKNSSRDPIIKDEAEDGHSESMVVDEQVRRMREQIGLDFGKIDYVMHQGKAVVLDVSKTIGGASGMRVAEFLSQGIDSYISKPQNSLSQ